MQDRITFFSDDDMAFGYEYKKIDNRLPVLLYGPQSLEDVLELVEISKYLCSPRLKVKNPKALKKINVTIDDWFSSVTDEELIEQISTSELSSIYENELWKKLVKRDFSDSNFRKVINLYKGHKIIYPLRQSFVRNRFGSLCCDILVQSVENVSIVLSGDYNDVKLPVEFNNEIRNALFMSFIESDNPNPNWLEDIAFDKNAFNEVRLAAKQRLQIEDDKHFSEAVPFGIETVVKFDKSMPADVDFDISNEMVGNTIKTSIKYNYHSLESLLDWPSILNTFIYLFGFVDDFGILSVSPKKEQDGVFERFLVNKKDDWFKDGRTVDDSLTLMKVSFFAYYKFLMSNGIRLEDVLEWFFKKYLADNFNVCGLSIELPKQYDRDEIKPLLAVTQLHRIVRMYGLLSLDFDFNRELIDDFSSVPRFVNIRSLTEQKYATLTDKKLKNSEFYLFSDQSAMPENGTLRFGDMIVRNLVSRSKLEEYQIRILNALVRDGVLICDGEIIRFTSSDLYYLLHFDFFEEAIPYSALKSSHEEHQLLDELERRGELDFSPMLLTKREASVFDYFFSDKYPNGKGLRNKYAHGSFGNVNNEERFDDYLTTLMFIVFLVVKINDDLNERFPLHS